MIDFKFSPHEKVIKNGLSGNFINIENVQKIHLKFSHHRNA